MMFCSIAAHNQDGIRVLDVDPVIRHSPTSERLCQSRYSRTVSDTRLVVDMDDPQAAHRLMNDGALFV